MATYQEAVRTFDHHELSQHEAYQPLRQALSDLANSLTDATLDGFLAAMRDMALTAPYADCCPRCRGKDGESYLHMAWPHAVQRTGDRLRCSYFCTRCSHTWTCGYAVQAAGIL